MLYTAFRSTDGVHVMTVVLAVVPVAVVDVGGIIVAAAAECAVSTARERISSDVICSIVIIAVIVARRLFMTLITTLIIIIVFVMITIFFEDKNAIKIITLTGLLDVVVNAFAICVIDHTDYCAQTQQLQ